MQWIEHEYPYIHKAMYDIDRMYKDISEKNFVTGGLFTMREYADVFESLFETCTLYGDLSHTPTFKPTTYEKIPKEILPENNKSILVCASGGKDSLATILHYRKMGYDVHIFHVAKINKGYYGEEQAIENIAEELQLPLHKVSVKIMGGNHCWVEHPLKNAIIANLALSYGIRENITTKIAFGNYSTAEAEFNTFAVCGGDSMTMWRAYENVIKSILPQFRVYVPLRNIKTMFNALSKEFEYVPLSISCMTPYRFRNQFKQRTENNYKVKLMDGRCGCCWKCAVEYIYFVDMGNIEIDVPYYIHCIEVLWYTLVKESGLRYRSIPSIWYEYIFYPINKSKAYKYLLGARITGKGKIIYDKEIE